MPKEIFQDSRLTLSGNEIYNFSGPCPKEALELRLREKINGFLDVSDQNEHIHLL